ncbi:fatty-acid--CoA ligase, partial [Diaphorobacter sp. DS2]
MMMQTPLTMTQMIRRAEKYFPKKTVVSRTAGGIQRLTYKEIAERTRKLAESLQKLGVERGD